MIAVLLLTLVGLGTAYIGACGLKYAELIERQVSFDSREFRRVLWFSTIQGIVTMGSDEIRVMSGVWVAVGLFFTGAALFSLVGALATGAPLW
jgi:hypothetical protein